MSNFASPYRRALAARDPAPSHAFIALHRCIEALARLTGERFCLIFDELAEKYGFSRNPNHWPRAEQIRQAAREVGARRESYLSRLSQLVAERRQEKKAGQRHRRRGELELLEQRRRSQNEAWPQLGYWGWKELRAHPGR